LEARGGAVTLAPTVSTLQRWPVVLCLSLTTWVAVHELVKASRGGVCWQGVSSSVSEESRSHAALLPAAPTSQRRTCAHSSDTGLRGAPLTGPPRARSDVEYLNSRDATIMGSRNGHAPIYMWYTLTRKGYEGMRKDVERCLRNAHLLKARPPGRPRCALALAYHPAPRSAAAVDGRAATRPRSLLRAMLPDLAACSVLCWVLGKLWR
jgi:hypothetical protein